MGAKAETMAQPQPTAPPKRKLRNYLLDTRFQLKYTGMVVAVAVVVASVLGYFAYDYSRGQTEALSINMAFQPELDAGTRDNLEGWSHAQDRTVLMAIIGGIAVLAIALGLTGIVVTHKVVGPAFKMKLLFREVKEGHLKVKGRLRRGDELQDVFLAFEQMIESLRARQADEVARLDAAIQRAREAGAPEEVLAGISDVRDQMQRELE